MNRCTLLVLVGLVGCAPTVCDQAQDWAERCDVAWADADTRACRDQLKGCTRLEKDRLDAFWACLDQKKFFTCDEGVDTGLAEPPAPEALLACRHELDNVSVACSGAIGIDGGEFGPEPTEPTGSTP